MIKKITIVVLTILLSGCFLKPDTNKREDANMNESYAFPSEEKAHEGTWLSWPHAYTYGKKYQKELEPIWIAMVKALHEKERVHILAYNTKEKERIKDVLQAQQINLNHVDFVISKTDDVWIRDSGPIFAYDDEKKLTILDFAFDGWGKKTPYKKDDAIPKTIAKDKDIPMQSIPNFVVEGGAIEFDGNKTLMACKSSVISKNRNKGVSQKEAEEYFKTYLGAENFIWLEGVLNQDITDAHIDGIARFLDNKTILTVSEDDFFDLYEDMPESDYEKLHSARNSEGDAYEIIELPMTSKNVEGLDYKGSYLNYYIANGVVLVPVYNDINDKEAIQILQSLYKDRNIVPINVEALYPYGGMLHCVTQQQPM